MTASGARTILSVSLIVFSSGFTIVHAQSAVVDSLRNQLALHQQDTLGLKVLLLIGSELARTDLEASRQSFYRGIALAKKLNTTYCLSGYYSMLTTSYQNFGQLDSAKKYLELLRVFATRDKSNETSTNYHMAAGLFYKNSSQFEIALPHMLKALEYIGNDKKYEVTKAGQLLNIGNTYFSLGDIERAAKYHLDALKRFESLGNQRGVSFCLQSLGNDFAKLKQFAKAIEYYEKSLAMKTALKDKRGVVSAWNAMGTVYVETNELNKALKTYRLALDQAKEMKLGLETADALFNIGVLQWKMREPADAKRSLLEALPIAKKRSDSLLVSRINASLAQMQVGDEDYHGGVEAGLLKKIEVAEVAGDQQAVIDGHYDLAEHYFRSRQFEKAFGSLKQYQVMSDSLGRVAVAVRFQEMEQEYQNEKKEKEIALLKKDQLLTQAIIAKQNADQRIIVLALISVVIVFIILIHYTRLRNKTRRREELSQVRNNIARDLHDDIGSALSSIHILSQLALKDQHGVPAHLQKISDSSVRTMESMSDIVWSINAENESVETLIIKMKEFAGEILEPKDIRYSFNFSDKVAHMKLDVIKRKNLFLIFKESVNNAAKYSKCTEVVIDLRSCDGDLHLTVKDNGEGFEASSVKYGNGIANMAERARDVKGKFVHNAAPGRGTEVTVQLPVT